MRIRAALTAAILSMVASLTALTTAQANDYNRAFWLVNNTNQAVYYVYISHVDTTDWGGDLLRDEVVPSGDRVALEPFWNEGYCRFDIKLVYDNGDVQYINNVDLCRVANVVATHATYEAYTS